jgi:hypothetical protein
LLLKPSGVVSLEDAFHDLLVWTCTTNKMKHE